MCKYISDREEGIKFINQCTSYIKQIMGKSGTKTTKTSFFKQRLSQLNGWFF